MGSWSRLLEEEKEFLLLPGFEPSFLLLYILDVRTSLSLTSASRVNRAPWNRLWSDRNSLTARCSV